MKNFKQLINSIAAIHQQLQKQAINAVNQALTIRNWLIGFYIVEYEQNGNDRAKYGTKLLSKLAFEFKNTKGLDERSFRNFRLFYKYYPQIGMFLNETSIRGSATTNLINLNIEVLPTQLPEYKKQGSLTTVSDNLKNRVLGKLIITKLSYTHLEQLIRINDDLKPKHNYS